MEVNTFKNDSYSWTEIRESVRMSCQERNLIDVSIGLLKSISEDRYVGDSSYRMISKLSRFIEATSGVEKFHFITYDIEQYLDEVVSISFLRHNGLKLSIYFDQPDMEGQDDFEEAVIIHHTSEGLKMRSGTIEDMVVVLDSIL